MKIFKISVLNMIIFLAAAPVILKAQSENEVDYYYSNPKAGISAKPPTPYNDASVVSKSEDLTVELQGQVGDTVVPKDSVKSSFDKEDYYDYQYSARINRFHRGMGFDYYDDYYTNLYWYTYDPFYWGTSIYYGYGWYPYGYYGWRPGWYASWQWVPSWGWNYAFGWSWGYYNPFWPGYWDYGGAYWDPFWPYYGYGYCYGWGGYDDYYGLNAGYASRGSYLGYRTPLQSTTSRGGRGVSTGSLSRGDGSAVLGGGTRRGGVDINRGSTARGTFYSDRKRYDKPVSVTNMRGNVLHSTRAEGRNDGATSLGSSAGRSSSYNTGRGYGASSNDNGTRRGGTGTSRSSSIRSGIGEDGRNVSSSRREVNVRSIPSDSRSSINGTSSNSRGSINGTSSNSRGSISGSSSNSRGSIGSSSSGSRGSIGSSSSGSRGSIGSSSSGSRSSIGGSSSGSRGGGYSSSRRR